MIPTVRDTAHCATARGIWWDKQPGGGSWGGGVVNDVAIPSDHLSRCGDVQHAAWEESEVQGVA